MLSRTATALALFAVGALAGPLDKRNSIDAITCKTLEHSLSSASAVYYPGSSNYTIDNEHWIPSSNEQSYCSVQPGTKEDVATILKVLAATTSRFGVKCGGHGTDQGFSSTTGVQIALSRLNSVVYNKQAQTLEIGLGQPWTDVYKKLDSVGVNTAGGRIVGVGTAGFILGGGYSWLTNKHGLGIESVISYEVVLPSGKIVTASATSYPDLFFGLKGGFNNFGIATSVTMKAYPQGQVYGGAIIYNETEIPAFVEALGAFQAQNKDVDGNVVGVYQVDENGIKNGFIAAFYNAPTAPAGFFDVFTKIPAFYTDLKTRSFVDNIVVTSAVFDNPKNLRGEFNSISIPAVNNVSMGIMVNATNYYGLGGPASFAPGSKVTVTLEPFLDTVINKDTNSAAMPHNLYASPTIIFFAWPKEDSDLSGGLAIRQMGDEIRNALAQKVSPLALTLPQFGNYALGTASVENMYNVNLPRLRQLRAKYDPNDLMLRTGGFKFV